MLIFELLTSIGLALVKEDVGTEKIPSTLSSPYLLVLCNPHQNSLHVTIPIKSSSLITLFWIGLLKLPTISLRSFESVVYLTWNSSRSFSFCHFVPLKSCWFQQKHFFVSSLYSHVTFSIILVSHTCYNYYLYFCHKYIQLAG